MRVCCGVWAAPAGGLSDDVQADDGFPVSYGILQDVLPTSADWAYITTNESGICEQLSKKTSNLFSIIIPVFVQIDEFALCFAIALTIPSASVLCAVINGFA